MRFDDRYERVAKAALEGAEGDTMTFPQIVGTLMNEGFEGYLIDFRRAVATYYVRDGEAIVQPTQSRGDVAAVFDAASIRAAIREAQQLLRGYTYAGFCKKVAAAGCAGYLVSFSGRRVLYFGRTGETHVEHFPD